MRTIGETSDTPLSSQEETHVSRIRLVLSSLPFVLLLALLPGGARAQGSGRAELERAIDADHLAGRYPDALAAIERELPKNTRDFELLWRKAENLTDWARVSPKEEQEARYEEAVGVARLAVEVRDQDAEGWFQLGKALGRLALFRGGKKKVEMSREVKEDFEKAIALKPDHAGALHGLARWHREVANLPWVLKTAAKIIYGGLPPASNEQAIELFHKAIALEPENIVHHLELGKTLLEVKDRDGARAEFQKALDLPQVRADDPEWQEEARRELARIHN
jgi:tetratricopeptide (TPR) repeat protein